MSKPNGNVKKLSEYGDSYEKFFPTPLKILKLIEADDIDGLRRALTPKQVKFAEEYTIDTNATKAARRAGYSPNSIQKQASMLLHHKGVRYLIDHLLQSTAAKIQTIDPDYLVAKIIAITDNESAKDTDKLRGLELLARLKGLFIEKTEISGPDGKAIEMEQRTKEAASDVISTLRSMAKKSKKLKVVGGSDVDSEVEAGLEDEAS